MIRLRFRGTVRIPPNLDPEYEISGFWRFSLRSFVELFQHQCCSPLYIEDRFIFIRGPNSAVDSGPKPTSMVCDDFNMVPSRSCSNIDVAQHYMPRIGFFLSGVRIPPLIRVQSRYLWLGTILTWFLHKVVLTSMLIWTLRIGSFVVGLRIGFGVCHLFTRVIFLSRYRGMRGGTTFSSEKSIQKKFINKWRAIIM